MKNSLISKILSAVLLLTGLSAVAGGYGLIFMDGLGMPLSSLSGSPFASYFWPGIILAFVVGGTNLLASVLLFKNHRLAPEAVGIAGFGMIIWIFTEMYIIFEGHLLHAFYFALGIVILLGAAALKFYVKK